MTKERYLSDGRNILIEMNMGAWTICRANAGIGKLGWPRVGILHSFYRSVAPSGENVAVQSQFKALADNGVDVTLIGVHSDEAITTKLAMVRTGIDFARGVGRIPPAEAQISELDVLHLHNTFPNISHKWLKQVPIPMVATVHNYRAFCAIGTFTRDEKRCFECADHSVWRSVAHSCYRNSFFASLPIAIQQSGPNSWAEFLDSLPLTLIPGGPMQRVLRDLGIRNTRVLLQPVGGLHPAVTKNRDSNAAWLFVGRLDKEKGILDLLRIWPPGEKLVVVGTGPCDQDSFDLVRSRGLDVELVGSKSQSEVQVMMEKSRGLIFPSIALEGAPLVYGESMSVGLPVIAAIGNVLAEQVHIDKTGTTFNLHDSKSLLLALDVTFTAWEQLSERCIEVHASGYTTSQWLEGIRQVYESVRV